MRIIISPAKKMNQEQDFMEPKNRPFFTDRAMELRDYLRGLSFEELKCLLACSDEIARLNFDRYRTMNPEKGLVAALLSYDGIQYKYMAPQVFEESYFEYVEEHLRILSGFYGILRPFDAITPYRLEMQAKVRTDFCRNLYDFWGRSLYDRLMEGNGDRIVINLASLEYSKSIEKYLEPDTTYITCTFGELAGDKIKEKGVYVKMARGEMVRFMAENKVRDPEGIKAFDRLGFRYSKPHSQPGNYVFLKEASKETEE